MATIEEELKEKFIWSDKNVDKRLMKMQREVVDHYLQTYNQVRSKVNDLYEKMKFNPSLFNASQYGRLKNIENQLQSILRQAGKVMEKNTSSFIKEQFAERYYEMGFALESSLQTNLRFGLLNPKTITASVINPYDRIKWNKRMEVGHEQLNSMVRQKLTEGIIQGQSYTAISGELKATLGNFAKNNVMRIVRTEGQRAMNWGNLTALNQAGDYAKEAGLEMLKVWIATVDERTRDMHQDMDGRHEDKGKEGGFTLPDGTWTQAPCLSGVAHHDINCRCTVIVEVEGMSPEFRRVRNDKKQNEVIPWKNYHQYKNSRIVNRKAPSKKPATVTRTTKKPKERPRPVRNKKVSPEHFVKDSVYKEDFFHTTSPENVASIKKNGFNLESITFGRVWGDGVYLSRNRATSKFYEERLKGKFETLTMKVNVKKPFKINLDDIDPEVGYWTTVQNKLEKVEKGISKRIQELESKYFKINRDNFENAPFRARGTDLTPEEIKIRGEYFERLRREGKTIYNEKAKAITEAMQERGYDAFEIIDTRIRTEFGGSQLVVFDPKNVMIAKPSKVEIYEAPEKIRNMLKKLESSEVQTLRNKKMEVVKRKNELADKITATPQTDMKLVDEYKKVVDEMRTIQMKLDKAEREVVEKARKLLYVKNPSTHLKPDIFGLKKKQTVEAGRKGLEEFSKLVDKKVIPSFEKEIKVGITGTRRHRSFQSGGKVYLSTYYVNTKTMVHEMGHWLEAWNKDIFNKVTDFFGQRTQSQTKQWLGKLTGDTRYRRNEKAFADKFIDPYMGKVYEFGGQRTASEIVSMGLQLFYEDPINFAIKDPEMFDFIYKLVRGMQ